MKRWLVGIAMTLSVLISVAGAVAWAMSYSRPPVWRAIGTAHSSDLTRVSRASGSMSFATAPTASQQPQPGFWDALWARSQSGTLTLLGQAIDYDGTLRRVHASPPSLVVEPAGNALARAVVFARAPETGQAGWPWFALRSDAQQVQGANGLVSARAWMLSVPYWFIILVGVPVPLMARLRSRSYRTRGTRPPAADPA